MVHFYVIGSSVAVMANSSTVRSKYGDFDIISFNLHGFYSSRSYLADLCNNPDTFIIGVQEHWLTPSNLHLLNSVHPDFACYAISSMNNKLTSGVFRGRPFGGVAFLWRKNIANNIEIISSEDSGRCLCVSLKYDNDKVIKLITVYFPCFEAGPEYINNLDRCLGFIDSVARVGDNIILFGDMNFRCDDSHIGFKHCSTAFNQLGIFNCDDLCSGNDRFTYYNQSLGHGSFIDHVMVSKSVRTLIDLINIVESGANLSDHKL